MKGILDIHTHRPLPQPLGVEALLVRDPGSLDILFNTEPDDGNGQLFSVGIHPWDTLAAPAPAVWERLEEAARLDSVAAIGESGLDLTPRGGPMFRQLLVFKRQAELAEFLHKPLVIHNVKGDDMILALRKDTGFRQPWVIHGFRKKPQAAESLLRAGMYLSFGAEFNPETLRRTPKERILAETDESELSIEQVIGRLSEAYDEDLTDTIRKNTAAVLGL